MDRIAGARKNGSFGYKAVVKYADGRTHIPVRKNFASSELAKAYAQEWIDANDARPKGIRAAKTVILGSAA